MPSGGSAAAIFPSHLISLNTSFGLPWIVPSTNMALQKSFNLFIWAAATNLPVLHDTNLQ
jgi:hypothetical protein